MHICTVKNMYSGYLRLSSNFDSNTPYQKTMTFKIGKERKHLSQILHPAKLTFEYKRV